MITAGQSRAARALLDWSQAQLADQSNLSESTIRNFEKGRAAPSVNNLAAVVRALEAAGCIFIAENGEGPGVRLRKVSGGERHAISEQIETLEAEIADMPAGGEPSPEGGMNTMRKAVAENDLAHLKVRRRKSEHK
ncbi:helix-turn-helix transcriptional regulator [Lichenihabitans sp. Uapishka_5]|uniref:helix-turn-helix transcriptional regulator n=1 Tax=Lichenihabitans sp. Uapishka_5 TaxID=3037302 RepID=UPI0029E80E6F|nr:helix-turn-helix transcriptional regulator [Lichenihabitans sp. Uapishka_5]